VHERGPIADVMRASMSIPGVFAPYEFRGCKHADGMLVANLPVDVARSLGADLVIAVEFTNKKSSNAKAFDRSPIAPLSRSLDILVRTTEAAQRSAADLVISVDVSGFDASNFDKAKEIAALARASACARRGPCGLSGPRQSRGPHRRYGSHPGAAPAVPRARPDRERGVRARRVLRGQGVAPVVSRAPDR
jgi:predicted acylesterase/phospholipase RssA